MEGVDAGRDLSRGEHIGGRAVGTVVYVPRVQLLRRLCAVTHFQAALALEGDRNGVHLGALRMPLGLAVVLGALEAGLLAGAHDCYERALEVDMLVEFPKR